MDYNFHTHTYLCSHASGMPEEYVKRAIECGIKYMGFSEHIPFVMDDGTESFYRLKKDDIQKYFDEIYRLRDKYKNDIDIIVGFEMEYYEDCFDQMLSDAVGYGAEYLILGQHFILPENRADSYYTYDKCEDDKILKNYVKSIVDAIGKNIFTYVAHPDIIRFEGNIEVFKEEFRKICIASREFDTPLEINFLGIRDNRTYPNERLFEIIAEEKSPVTFGFDSHDVLNAYDGTSLIKAKDFVDKYRLNYIGKPKIKKLK